MVTVNVLIVRDQEVLLVKRVNEPAKGGWFTPGGIIRKDECLKESVLRVCREETGLEVELIGLLGVYDEFWKQGYFSRDVHLITIGYSAIPLGGELKPDWQSSEVKSFPINKLPDNTGTTVKKFVEQYFIKNAKVTNQSSN